MKSSDNLAEGLCCERTARRGKGEAGSRKLAGRRGGPLSPRGQEERRVKALRGVRRLPSWQTPHTGDGDYLGGGRGGQMGGEEPVG